MLKVLQTGNVGESESDLRSFETEEAPDFKRILNYSNVSSFKSNFCSTNFLHNMKSQSSVTAGRLLI